MSKKVVPFKLPPVTYPKAGEMDMNELPQAGEASTSAGEDGWVRMAQAEIARSTAAEKPAAGSTAGPVLIDISATRTWFELVQLVSLFPYVATWHWMQNFNTAMLKASQGKSD